VSAAFLDPQRALGGSELAASEAAVAAWLAEDCGQAVRCGLLADNGVPWAIVDRVLQRSAAVTVPLPRHFSPAQLAHVIEDASVERIITDDPRQLPGLPGAWQLRDTGEFGLQRWARAARAAPSPALPAGTAKITYTSGSTGNPKGVCLTREAMRAVVTSLAAALAPLGVTRHLCLLPLSTLLDNLVSVEVAPALGATVCLPSLEESGIGYGGLDVRRMLACLGRYAPESLLLVPELLRVLVYAAESGWRPPAGLKFIAVGGSAVSPDLLHAAQAAGLPAHEGYGLSECASVVALNLPGAERKGSVGRVLPHATVRIDAAGEIHVRGATMRGYLGDGDGDGDGSEHGDEIATGDLGFIDDDGFLHVRGRRKNLLITSLGRNVSPEWVERELLASPDLAQAVVFGEARPFLCALVHPAAAALGHVRLGAAIAAANRNLPEYAQVRRWALLPEPLGAVDGAVTANGRIRREVVFSRYAALIEELYADAIAG
jgi:long-subunit acyl-CoA synthetase (AMP-forming)